MSDETTKNSGVKISIDLDLADLMIVADALSIGGNAGIMSHDGHASGHRLYEIREQILELLPLEKGHQRDGGYQWFEAMNALKRSEYYDVFISEIEDWRNTRYQVFIEADKKRFLITNDEINKEEAETVIPMLEDLFDRYSSHDSVKLTQMEEIDVYIEFEKASYRFHEDRSLFQKAFNDLLDNEDIHARVRFAKKTYDSDKKINDKYLHTLLISAPKHQHDLIKEICAKHIEDLKNEGTTAPKM